MRVLSYVSRDSRQLDVFASRFFLLIKRIYNLLQQIPIVICISMLMLQHKRKLKVDNGLLRKSDFHIGYPVTSTIRMMVNVNNLTTKQNFENKQALLMRKNTSYDSVFVRD